MSLSILIQIIHDSFLILIPSIINPKKAHLKEGLALQDTYNQSKHFFTVSREISPNYTSPEFGALKIMDQRIY